MVDHIDSAKRSWNMGRIRAKDTVPEVQVRSLLHRLGYRFRLHRKDLPGTPDIVLAKYRTVVFVHGCYWHRHLGCKYASTPKTNSDFWMGKFESNIARDRMNRTELANNGWNVLVVWQCELRDIDGLAQRLSKALSPDSIMA
jgi:DNA mismatch endonuclease (patch repair protein)